MRRQRLIWFMLGLLVSTTVWILTTVLNEEIVLDRTQTPYLVLSDALVPHDDEATEYPEPMIPDRAANLLRECGAWYFETTFAYEDHPPTAELPIIPENFEAMECALPKLANEGFLLGLESRWGEVDRQAILESQQAGRSEAE